MMNKNNLLYQYLIILLGLSLGSPSLVLASDDVSTKNGQSVMPAAPSGPYRSYIASDAENQKSSLAQRPIQLKQAPQFDQRAQSPSVPTQNINRNRFQSMPAPRLAQRPPQQRIPVPKVNRNSFQPMPAPRFSQQPPQQRIPTQQFIQRPPQHHIPLPPAWVRRPPHSMPAPQWFQPKVPDWVRNPPRGPKPPSWVTNPQRQPMYRYGNPYRN